MRGYTPSDYTSIIPVVLRESEFAFGPILGFLLPVGQAGGIPRQHSDVVVLRYGDLADSYQRVSTEYSSSESVRKAGVKGDSSTQILLTPGLRRRAATDPLVGVECGFFHSLSSIRGQGR